MRVLGGVVLAVFVSTATAWGRAPDGARLYRTHCAGCHGLEGRGDGPEAPFFDPPPRDLRSETIARYSRADLVRRIREGTPLQLGLDPARLREHAGEVELIVAHMSRLAEIDWDRAERGEEIWVDRCEACHGPYGRPGAAFPPGMPRPRDLSDPTLQRQLTDAQLGVLLRHDREGMPALQPPLSESDVHALLAYVRLLSPGFALYNRYCRGCHGEDGRGVRDLLGELRPPAVVFNREYFRTHDGEYVRTRAWHMLAEQKPQMPHFRGQLGEREAQAIVDWLRASARAPGRRP